MTENELENCIIKVVSERHIDGLGDLDLYVGIDMKDNNISTSRLMGAVQRLIDEGLLTMDGDILRMVTPREISKRRCTK